MSISSSGADRLLLEARLVEIGSAPLLSGFGEGKGASLTSLAGAAVRVAASACATDLIAAAAAACVRLKRGVSLSVAAAPAHAQRAQLRAARTLVAGGAATNANRSPQETSQDVSQQVDCVVSRRVEWFRRFG